MVKFYRLGRLPAARSASLCVALREISSNVRNFAAFSRSASFDAFAPFPRKLSGGVGSVVIAGGVTSLLNNPDIKLSPPRTNTLTFLK
jgi:hypothetical protein